MIEKFLISEVREWWRFWSARLLVLALAIDALALSPVLAMLPPSVRGALPPAVFEAIQFILVAAALAARFVRQRKLEVRRERPETRPE